MQKNIDKKLRFIVLSLELNRFTISIRHESTSWSPWWQMKHAQNIVLPRSQYKNDSLTHLIWIMNTTHLCTKKKVFFAANRWIKVNITFLSCKHQKNSGYTQSNCTHGNIDFLGTTIAKKKGWLVRSCFLYLQHDHRRNQSSCILNLIPMHSKCKPDHQ